MRCIPIALLFSFMVGLITVKMPLGRKVGILIVTPIILVIEFGLYFCIFLHVIGYH